MIQIKAVKKIKNNAMTIMSAGQFGTHIKLSPNYFILDIMCLLI